VPRVHAPLLLFLHFLFLYLLYHDVFHLDLNVVFGVGVGVFGLPAAA
jgi:hypothetical protein